MNLKEFVVGLTKFVESNPQLGEMIVVASSDEEGNEFNEVVYEPCKGFLKGRKFIPFDNFQDFDNEILEVNAVCIN
jgi:hypothetical protein